MTPVEVGHTLLIGAGAVGSAIGWLLSLLMVRGHVDVIDGDEVEYSNLNRSPLFAVNDVGRAKADVVAGWLSRTGISARAVPHWLDEALERSVVFQRRPDLVFPAANERNVRHLIQHQLPPLQVYGTTGRNWDAFLGRHIPLREDCLACRFPAAQAIPELACGDGSVGAEERTGQRLDAALPFLPTAAAVMACAELMKLDREGFPVNPNFACLDFLGQLDDFICSPRPAKPECICGHQRGVWHKFNRDSRFASLSIEHEQEFRAG